MELFPEKYLVITDNNQGWFSKIFVPLPPYN